MTPTCFGRTRPSSGSITIFSYMKLLVFVPWCGGVPQLITHVHAVSFIWIWYNAFVEIDVIISSYYSHGNRYYNLRLCVHVIPVCPVDIPAVSGVVSVLKYCVWERGAYMKSYRILCSYGCCSVISVFLWWWCCIINVTGF